MKKVLFMACMVCLLLFGLAAASAEIDSWSFPDPLYSTDGFEIDVGYNKQVQEWQAHIVKAPEDCSYVPSTVTCTAEWVCHKIDGEYRYDKGVPVTAKVTWICDGAFKDCKGLTRVHLEPGVELISNEAFAGCPLTEIYVPDSVTSIGENAFKDTTPVSVTLPFTGFSRDRSGGNYLFKYIFSGFGSEDGAIPDTIRSVTITDETVIYAGAFKDCDKITTIQLPDKVTSIEYSVFEGCTALKDFKLPASLERIDYATFRGCANAFKGALDLSGVNKFLGNSAFEGCTGITSVTFDPELETIWKKAFKGCTDIAEVRFASGLKTIESEAFSGCPLTEIVVPDSVTFIGEKAFEGSRPVNVTLPFIGEGRGRTSSANMRNTFKYVFSGAFSEPGDIPETIRTVTVTDQTAFYHEAFMNCDQLVTISIPDATKHFEGSAFAGCTALTDFQLPSGLEYVNNDAFRGCASALTGEIDLSGVKGSIGSYAFEGCTGVTGVIFGAELEGIGERAFSGCPLTEIVVPDSVTDIGASAFAGSVPENVTLPFTGSRRNNTSGNARFFSWIFAGYDGWSADIPDTVRTVTVTDQGGICYEAFRDCTGITEIHIGDATTYISTYSFRGCTALEKITLPAGLESIGWSAFEGCTALQELVLPAGLESISNNTFEGCTALRELALPAGLESIGNCAFNGCTALQKLALPAGLRSISWDAFVGCTALESVRYGGSPCMRALIQIDSSNEPLSAAAWEYALTKELLLPQGVQEIGSEALAGTAAQVVLIPEGCAAVAVDAFDNCPELRYIVSQSELEIDAPDGVTVLKR